MQIGSLSALEPEEPELPLAASCSPFRPFRAGLAGRSQVEDDNGCNCEFGSLEEHPLTTRKYSRILSVTGGTDIVSTAMSADCNADMPNINMSAPAHQ